MTSRGVIVGCDAEQQWLLPWWWKNYSTHNDIPVAFIDWGMGEESLAFCRERGSIITPAPIPSTFSSKEQISEPIIQSWKKRYTALSLNDEFWTLRNAWLKKPFALLEAPFAYNLWLDLDCQVLGRLDGVFEGLQDAEIGMVRDHNQEGLLLAGEVLYNAGVIAFKNNAPILHRWVETVIALQDQLPTDQELLTRAIFLHQPKIVEYSQLYNWPFFWGPKDRAVIYHFCGIVGKIILRSILQL